LIPAIPARAAGRLVRASWGVAAPLAGLAAARLAGYDGQPLIVIANAGTPFVYVPTYGALAVGLATRRRGLAAVAATVGAAHLVWTAPEVRRRRSEPEIGEGTTRVRLVTSNIESPRRDSTALGQELAGFGADILLLQELSPRHLALIKATGAFDPFPYSYVHARPGSFGAGIWSRYPLSDEETWTPAGMPQVRATVDVEGTRIRVFNVHCKAPTRKRWVPAWKAQLAALRGEVEAGIAAGDGPLIVAGDFNATYGHEPFRRLLGAGMREAHIEVGRGLAPTWPVTSRFVPPLFRLDHVLVSPDVAVLDVREGRGPGSDHRPVVADLAVSRGGR
jgi:endonuclease/exonuclease/phosphatase family metal-dependent hydrolase